MKTVIKGREKDDRYYELVRAHRRVSNELGPASSERQWNELCVIERELQAYDNFEMNDE